MKKIGIYKIFCLANQKIYIGQSIDVFERFIQHKSDLRGNRHKNKHLQYAWNKYGEQNFSFEVLEECKKEELDKKERYWIDLFGGKDSKNNFNQKDGGHKNVCFSEESIFFMKKIKKGKHFSIKTEFKKGMIPWNKNKKGYSLQKNGKKVYQYDLNGNFLQEYLTVAKAAKEIGVSVSLISLCCLKQKIGHGFQWSYVKKEKISKKQYSTKKKTKVYQYDLNGNFLKLFSSIKEAADNVKIQYPSISYCCKYKKGSAGGFQWRYFLQNNGIGKLGKYKKR